MKQPIKLLLGVLAAASVTGLAFFGWSAKAKDDTTVHLANGVRVTPVEVQPDDVAQLLDAKIWKFNVIVPDPNNFHRYSLLLYKHGKFVKSLAGCSIGPMKKSDNDPQVRLTLGMVSLDDDFGKSQRIKYILRSEGTGTSGTFDNPLKNSNSYGTETQASASENLIFLMSGTDSRSSYGEARLNDTAIALEIRPDATTKY